MKQNKELDFKLEVGGEYLTRLGQRVIITAIEDIPEEVLSTRKSANIQPPYFTVHGYRYTNNWYTDSWTINGRSDIYDNECSCDIVAQKSPLDDSPEWLREAVRNGGWCKTRGGDKVWVYATPLEILKSCIKLGRAPISVLNSYGYLYSIYIDGRYVRDINHNKDQDLIGPWTDD